MNKTILFSPVGGTDPISSTNCRDGSLLHICRVYKPDKVYLYMSYEMLEYQKADNRYLYCLERLSSLQNHKMEYEIIERGRLKDVQKFDYFYEDFRIIIKDILEKMDETDRLLLNVSSGTPAMKSGLLVLTTLGEFSCKSIQVSTPEKGINEHIHRDYDVVTLWELNEDNEQEFENRCEEVKCPTLSLIKNEEIIKKHIMAYDYAAAVEAANALPKEKISSYIELLEMAQLRLLLDLNATAKKIERTGFNCYPVRSGDAKKYFEYTLLLDVKRKRGEYADYIRALTPLFVDLFEIVLKKAENINLNDFCKTKKGGARNWDQKKLKATEKGRKIEYVLNEQMLLKRNRNFDFSKEVSSFALAFLIEGCCGNARLITLVKNLRSIEDNIRNLAAHQIVSVTEESIKQLTGFSSEKIMDMIKETFEYTGMNIKLEYWDSYEDMNAEIIKRMG